VAGIKKLIDFAQGGKSELSGSNCILFLMFTSFDIVLGVLRRLSVYCYIGISVSCTWKVISYLVLNKIHYNMRLSRFVNNKKLYVIFSFLSE